MKLADRCGRIDSSGIRKVFNLAAQLKNPCNLSIGQPDFDVPEDIKDAAIAAIRAGKNKYTLTNGIAPLREKLLTLYRERGVSQEDVIITSGTSGGILLCFMATLNPGDEILIPDPYFVMYKHLANFIGAKPVYVDTYPDFRLRRETLDACLSPKTRALILNSPCNPTGTVYSEAELRMAGEFCRQHNLLLFSDEIYEPFVYDGVFHSAGEYYPDAIILSGLSKSSAMTGWRLGWVLGPKSLIAAMGNIQMYTFVCAPSFAQEAALVALDRDLKAVQDDYRRRRDIIYEGLQSAGFTVQRSAGAFYIFPEAPGGDGDAFVKQCIENELLVVPGSVFSERKSNFRISFAASEAELRRGIQILRDVAGKS